MAHFILTKGAQLATKKILDRELDKNKDKKVGGQYDPYYEYRPNKRGKMKKVKKQIPAYIPAHDAKILAEARKSAYRLDMQFSILGLRCGVSSIAGLVPALGDVADTILALNFFRKCCQIEGGLDKKTKAQMMVWIAFDTVIGLVPVVGDVLDAQFKCNARNCRLLEEFLDRKYKPKEAQEEERRRRAEDPHYKPAAPATAYEDFSDEEIERARAMEEGAAVGHSRQQQSVEYGVTEESSHGTRPSERRR